MTPTTLPIEEFPETAREVIDAALALDRRYDTLHNHGTGTTTGYRVVRTVTADGLLYARETVAVVDGSTNYVRALEILRAFRDRAQGEEWYLPDHIYRCGCRFDPERPPAFYTQERIVALCRSANLTSRSRADDGTRTRRVEWPAEGRHVDVVVQGAPRRENGEHVGWEPDSWGDERGWEEFNPDLILDKAIELRLAEDARP